MSEMFSPKSYRDYCDKYFLRAKEILVADKLNPWVRAQVFIRKGPGIYSCRDAVKMILENSQIATIPGCSLRAKIVGQTYQPKEVVLEIIAPVQEIIELETVYLGDITYYTTMASTCKNTPLGVTPSFTHITETMKRIRSLIGSRTLIYMGARHWLWGFDPQFAYAAHLGGVDSCSTDAGAAMWDAVGVGTIPHALENVYAWKYGEENAVSESTMAFHKWIDPDVPRIALVDYRNCEITDAMKIAGLLGDALYGIRIDTCGENAMEYAPELDPHKIDYVFDMYRRYDWSRNVLYSKFNQRVRIDQIYTDHMKYWICNRGVNILGVYQLAYIIRQYFPNLKIILSSGFGNPEKVAAFVEAEKILGIKLFDGIGAGDVFGCPDIRISTMDITHVGIGYSDLSLKEVHKVGRGPSYNDSLVDVI